MTKIFIDILILLEHRSQVAKGVFFGYYLTMSLTSPSFCVVALKSHFMYSLLDLLSLKPFASKVRLHNSNFWSTPVLLSSTKTTSSTNSIHQEIPPCMVFKASPRRQGGQKTEASWTRHFSRLILFSFSFPYFSPFPGIFLVIWRHLVSPCLVLRVA
jgi:hypothetical protein